MYSEKFDRIAESIYKKIYEDVQQDTLVMPQQQPGTQTMPTEPVGPQQDVQAGQQVPMQEPIQGQVDAGAQEAPQDNSGGEIDNFDGVDMSEIQELAGQLSQMLRDFKAANGEESVEASKFAAGMVVAAAIDGLSYKDRKSIIKKIKGGGFESAGGQDETQMDDQSETQEPVQESFRDRNEDEQEKRNKNRKKRPSKKNGSPFDGVNEEGKNVILQTSGDTKSIDAAYQKLGIGDNLTVVSDETSAFVPVKSLADGKQQMLSGDGFGFSVKKESLIMTKAQMEKCRLYEMKNRGVSFKKSELDEIFFK